MAATVLVLRKYACKFFSRKLSRCLCNTASTTKKGLVLGVYESEKEHVYLTPAAQKYNQITNQRLVELLTLSGLPLKKGKARLFYGLEKEFAVVAVVGLGSKAREYNELEEVDEGREAVRAAAAGGCKALQETEVAHIALDPCLDAEAMAEGANLSLWVYDELKEKSKRKPVIELDLYQEFKDSKELYWNPGMLASEAWQRGTIKAEGQNLARTLTETPANYMTPTVFAQIAQEVLGQKDIAVTVHDRAWAEEKKMAAFLSVARGSVEPPVFLEISYQGAAEDENPVVLVGKGVTFDTGGISLKPAKSMDKMRGDMGGAACTVAAISTVADLKFSINVKGLIPLCENMPSGSATKPGDVITAMNGKTIQVDNTDAEGRLILADALCYSQQFQPSVVLNMATLTGAMVVALGSGAAGVFTNSATMWHHIHSAAVRTGDRVWRMPLWKHYSKQVTDSELADLSNIGKHPREGGACTAAAFLKEFAPEDNWLHVDIAGVMENKDEVPYLGKGMAGRPTRTIVEFIHNLSESLVK